MGQFLNQIEDAVQEGVCAILAGGAESVGFFQGVVRGLLDPFPPPPVPNLPAIFHREVCDRNPPPPPDPEFQGGQCTFPYTLFGSFTYRIYNPSTGTFIQEFTVSGSSTIQGPVRSFRLITSLDGTGTVYTWILRAVSDTQVRDVCSASAGVNTQIEPPGNIIRTATPVGGGPDICGNPPPPGPPDGFNTRPFTINFSPSVGGPTLITGDITLTGPSISTGGVTVGDIVITFEDPILEIPVTINGQINLSTGGVTLNIGGGGQPPGGGGPNPPPDGDTRTIPSPPPGDEVGGPPGGGPPPESDNPEGDEPPPEEPPDGDPGLGRKLIGVLAWVDNAGDAATQVFDNDSPRLNLPDIGSVVFKVSVAGQISYLAPIKIQYKRQWIPCPDLAGAVGASVINRPGVPVRLSYVYDLRGIRST